MLSASTSLCLVSKQVHAGANRRRAHRGRHCSARIFAFTKVAPALWRRGEGVEPSGKRIARQAGFEDRWGHRAPSSSRRISTYVALMFLRSIKVSELRR